METPLQRIKTEANYQASIQNDVYDQSIELGYTLGGVAAHNKAIDDAAQKAKELLPEMWRDHIVEEISKLKITL